ncbi:MAG TPA: putative sulfate exporter family transporter, partial [Aliarcobacter thereius]
VVVAFNSFDFLNIKTIETINYIDMTVLTMAMFALGLNTNLKKFKEVGIKPFYLSFTLFIYLCFMGYFLVWFFV